MQCLCASNADLLIWKGCLVASLLTVTTINPQVLLPHHKTFVHMDGHIYIYLYLFKFTLHIFINLHKFTHKNTTNRNKIADMHQLFHLFKSAIIFVPIGLFCFFFIFLQFKANKNTMHTNVKHTTVKL